MSPRLPAHDYFQLHTALSMERDVRRQMAFANVTLRIDRRRHVWKFRCGQAVIAEYEPCRQRLTLLADPPRKCRSPRLAARLIAERIRHSG